MCSIQIYTTQLSLLPGLYSKLDSAVQICGLSYIKCGHFRRRKMLSVGKHYASWSEYFSQIVAHLGIIQLRYRELIEQLLELSVDAEE